MKAENSRLRKIGFIKFIFLFLAIMVFVIAAFYMNFRIPREENKVLKAEIAQIKVEMEFQDRFSNDMAKVNQMLDSLSIEGQSVSYLNTLIAAQLVEMKKSIPRKESVQQYEMYTQMIKSYAQMQELKKELHTLKDAKETINEYKEALEQCREELSETQRNLDIFRANRK